MSSPSPSSDPSELRIARARRGDRRALEELLQPHLPRLVYLVERRLPAVLNGKESAADIVQSTCHEILRGLSGFDSHGEGERAFRRWLYASTLRKLRDRERHHRRQKRDLAREVTHGGDPWERLYRSTGTPSRQAMRAEQREQLEAALERLSEGHREVITLVYFEGCSVPEVAARLGKSSAAVHSLLARALARLAGVMSDQAP